MSAPTGDLSAPTTPTTPTTPSTPSKPKKTKKEMLMGIWNSFRCNPSGARLIHDSNFAQNMPLMSGYLNFDSTKPLRELINATPSDDDEAGRLVSKASDWLAFKPNNHNITIPRVKAMLENRSFRAKIMAGFDHCAFPLSAASTEELGQGAADFLKSEEDIIYGNLIFSAWRIRPHLPHGCLSGPLVDNDESDFIDGVHPEDWLRLAMLLRCKERQKKRSSSNKSGRSRTMPAITVNFFTDADITKAKAAASHSEDDSEPDPDSDAYSEDESIDAPDFEKTQALILGQIATTSGETFSSKPLPAKRRAKVLDSLFQSMVKRGGIEYPTMKGGPLDHFANLPVSNSSLHGNLDPDTTSIRAAGEKAEEIRKFHELQNALNCASAPSVHFSEACTSLDFDIDDEGSWHVEGSSRILRPHQILALSWTAHMLNKLGYGFLALDVGLGKKTVAMAAIASLSGMGASFSCAQTLKFSCVRTGSLQAPRHLKT
ncbi:hypothetical protein HDK90DRAFT_511046 [Phyllosticta capitalensis]|uniref:SNF2 N-terminal domain-containing protein n=1 Tax=Phyllosticta capitalensis TaxID=121624 RepID=A0ABR1YR68_9PEZI